MACTCKQSEDAWICAVEKGLETHNCPCPCHKWDEVFAPENFVKPPAGEGLDFTIKPPQKGTDKSTMARRLTCETCIYAFKKGTESPCNLCNPIGTMYVPKITIETPMETTDTLFTDDQANWLWIQFMDWCKKRGVPPSDYNDLFSIIGRARKEGKP